MGDAIDRVRNQWATQSIGSAANGRRNRLGPQPMGDAIDWVRSQWATQSIDEGGWAAHGLDLLNTGAINAILQWQSMAHVLDLLNTAHQWQSVAHVLDLLNAAHQWQSVAHV